MFNIFNSDIKSANKQIASLSKDKESLEATITTLHAEIEDYKKTIAAYPLASSHYEEQTNTLIADHNSAIEKLRATYETKIAELSTTVETTASSVSAEVAKTVASIGIDTAKIKTTESSNVEKNGFKVTVISKM